MEPLNPDDYADWLSFTNDDPPRLGSLIPLNSPERSGWMSRRTIVNRVVGWEFSWFTTNGNFLLRFAQCDPNEAPCEVLYLPEAAVRHCQPSEDCCSGRPSVLEISAPVTYLSRTAIQGSTAHAQLTYISFESSDEMYGWEAFLGNLCARRSVTARITFGRPLDIQHRIRLNTIEREGTPNFGVELLGVEMIQWLLHQGLTIDDIKGNEALAMRCAQVLMELVEQQAAEGGSNLSFTPPPLAAAAGGPTVKFREQAGPQRRGEAKGDRVVAKNRKGAEENPTEAGTDTGAQAKILKPRFPVELKSIKLDSLITVGDPHQLYTSMKLFDSGSQGDVFCGLRRSDMAPVAIKRVKIRNERSDLTALVGEIALLKACCHPNIVRLYDCHKRDRDVFIVMEFMGGGKLTDVLEVNEQTGRHFEEREVATIIQHVLRGLQCLHAENCLHRDIKSDNVLLNDAGDVKLGDLGFATRIADGQRQRKTMVGTPYWMAPEITRGDPYDLKADIWSCGVLLIELCDSKPPWMGVNPMRALLKISTSPPPRIQSAKRWSQLCNDFAAFLLVKDPKKRPDVNAALKHPFLATAERDCHFLTKYIARKEAQGKKPQPPMNGAPKPPK